MKTIGTLSYILCWKELIVITFSYPAVEHVKWFAPYLVGAAPSRDFSQHVVLVWYWIGCIFLLPR